VFFVSGTIDMKKAWIYMESYTLGISYSFAVHLEL